MGNQLSAEIVLHLYRSMGMCRDDYLPWDKQAAMARGKSRRATYATRSPSPSPVHDETVVQLENEDGADNAAEVVGDGPACCETGHFDPLSPDMEDVLLQMLPKDEGRHAFDFSKGPFDFSKVEVIKHDPKEWRTTAGRVVQKWDHTLDWVVRMVVPQDCRKGFHM